jgi:hypothetical protein
LIALALPALLAGCAAAGDDPVTLSIVNAGQAPLRCLVIHGHWVTADVPVIAPGARADVDVLRDPTEKSLFTLREDGRRLMIEQIACGLDRNWSATLAYADVEVARSGDAPRAVLTCDVTRPRGCATFQAAP